MIQEVLELLPQVGTVLNALNRFRVRRVQREMLCYLIQMNQAFNRLLDPEDELVLTIPIIRSLTPLKYRLLKKRHSKNA